QHGEYLERPRLARVEVRLEPDGRHGSERDRSFRSDLRDVVDADREHRRVGVQQAVRDEAHPDRKQVADEAAALADEDRDREHDQDRLSYGRRASGAQAPGHEHGAVDQEEDGDGAPKTGDVPSLQSLRRRAEAPPRGKRSNRRSRRRRPLSGPRYESLSL